MRSSFKAIAEWPLHEFGIVPKTTGLILQIPPELRKLELKDLIASQGEKLTAFLGNDQIFEL